MFYQFEIKVSLLLNYLLLLRVNKNVASHISPPVPSAPSGSMSNVWVTLAACSALFGDVQTSRVISPFYSSFSKKRLNRVPSLVNPN